ncbi:methylmalonyl-CoA mutase family protein [Porifericola rhodea]|uniref:methylmalonyl-CoA mutase family protein n=1 Tax=Porifericola rhodea TaxID=930972 RepID=UPI00266552FE|nr:methylmalonyl-CoA mutase family protein [Porifericola rhodea]WKN31195.1 methylmalonyl-CoA mutase family protein [Porifericola rhodea]
MSLLYQDMNPLFGDFSSHTLEEWKEQAARNFERKDFQKFLLGKEVDGIQMYPFYTKTNNSSLFYKNLQKTDKAYIPKNWEFEDKIYLNHELKEVEANRLALQFLEQGTEALYFDCTGFFQAPLWKELLQDILLDGVSINLKLPTNLKVENLEFSKVMRGLILLSPLEEHLLKKQDPSSGLALLSALLKKDIPKMKKLSVDGSFLTNSGASVVQELGISLSLIVSYLDYLTDKGHKVHHLFNNLSISLGTRSAYFIDIAKFRVFKILLQQLAEAYGLSESVDIPIRAISSTYNKSAYDINTNMLRNTSEAMAAVLGACQYISISSHNLSDTTDNSFGRRIARNISHMLKHESHLDLVNDPLAGSYAIEELTEQIATKAWAYFLEIEQEGGLLEAYKNGKVQRDIKQNTNKYLNQVSGLKKVLVGANRYADSTNKVPELIKSNQPSGDLTSINGPSVIENIRFSVDQYVAHGGSRPVLGILKLNNKAKAAIISTRVSFVRDILSTIGMESTYLSSSLFDLNHPDNSLEAYDGLVIISDDEQYEMLNPAQLKSISQSYYFPLILAGYPPQISSEASAYGIFDFIRWGMHVPDFAHKFFERINLKLNEA